MMQIQKDWVDLEECPTNIWDIEMKVKEFYRLMDTDEEDFDEYRINLVRALGYLNSARTLLKNYIMPENNIYIKEEELEYKWMIDNLGRADKRLDEIQKNTIEQLENAKMISIDISKSSKIVNYSKFLFEYMEHLVYFPIKRAYEKFINFNESINVDGIEKKIKKDEKLFLYFVFLELYHSSEALGGLTREPVKVTPKLHGTSTEYPTTYTPPPSTPKNPEIEEEHEEEEEYKHLDESQEEEQDDIF